MNHHQRPYGVGVAYRYVLHQDVLNNRDRIDLLELPTEDYIVRKRNLFADPHEELLKEAMDIFPCTAHGISLSVGSVEPLDESYLLSTKRFLERHQLNVFSEHLAFHRIEGNDLSVFLSMPYDETSISWLKKNYYAVRKYLDRPFGLENVTYYFSVSDCAMTEAQFLCRLTEETDCTLLLDATNVFNNAHNHGNYDPLEFLDQIPLDRVKQIHLAGGHLVDGKWEDSHSAPVMEPVWEIYEKIIAGSEAEIVILERDSKFHHFDEVMKDVERAREIFYKYRPENPADKPLPTTVVAQPWEGAEPDPESADYHQLSRFQKGLMSRITKPEFKKDYSENPDAALGALGLDADWVQRVKSCDPGSLKHLCHVWDGITQEEGEMGKLYERTEWSGWANQINDFNR